MGIGGLPLSKVYIDDSISRYISGINNRLPIENQKQIFTVL